MKTYTHTSAHTLLLYTLQDGSLPCRNFLGRLINFLQPWISDAVSLVHFRLGVTSPLTSTQGGRSGLCSLLIYPIYCRKKSIIILFAAKFSPSHFLTETKSFLMSRRKVRSHYLNSILTRPSTILRLIQSVPTIISSRCLCSLSQNVGLQPVLWQMTQLWGLARGELCTVTSSLRPNVLKPPFVTSWQELSTIWSSGATTTLPSPSDKS